MCGIAISTDRNRFINILTENEARRGGFAHSTMALNFVDGRFVLADLNRRLGRFSGDCLPDADLYIGHTQAPTGGLSESTNRLHPAELDGVYMYHNGILKRRYLIANDWFGQWDTALMLKKYVENNLNDVDGSFACVVYDDAVGDIEIFRNDSAPLYINDNFDVSSIPLNAEYKMIDAGVVSVLNSVPIRLYAGADFQNNDKFYR